MIEAVCVKEFMMARRKEMVTRVIDGDTFLTASRKRAVKLANFDAPERGKKGSVKATRVLRKLIQGKKVEVHTIGRDAFGRVIANVKVGGKPLNKAIRSKARK